jgi:hypothetical protein
MKVLLLALFPVCLVAMTGCATGVPEGSDSMHVTVHTSRNAPDWAGVYEGILPCADCPGIWTRIELAPGQTYVMSMRYLDREAAPRTSRGTFKWDAEGRNIELQGSQGGSWRFQVREDSLALLDRQGQPITENLAQNYVLKKVDGPGASPAPAASLTGAPSSWQLVGAFRGHRGRARQQLQRGIRQSPAAFAAGVHSSCMHRS